MSFYDYAALSLAQQNVKKNCKNDLYNHIDIPEFRVIQDTFEKR